MEQYNVTGMSCAACQARVEKAVSAVPGVTSCAVSLLTNSMGVEGTADEASIIKAVTDAGYGASKKGASAIPAAENADALADTETPKLIRRLIASAAFLLVLMYFSMGHMMWGWPLPSFFEGNHVAMGLVQMLLAAAVMIINQKFFISGVKGLIHRAPNMDTLVSLGSGASFVYSVCSLFAMTADVAGGGNGESYMDRFYFESAAMILVLITVGKLLEARSKGKTTNALKALMRLAPQSAVILINGAQTEVPINQVKKGDVFIVKPGEKYPVDGTVLEGAGAADESALTGESIPVDKAPGSFVSAGTVNLNGYMKCEAARVGEDTTLSQIIKMVSDAAATKAPIAKTADRVSGVFVPVVIGIAIVAAAVWLAAGKDMGFALSRGISVLVISCPCALGLATPVAIMVGSGLGARNGILFKTAAALEQTGKTRIVALDKTGTITNGAPVLTDIVPANGISEEELLTFAAALETKSEHPLAKAITAAAAERGVTPPEINDFTAVPGKGLQGNLNGKTLSGGKRAFIRNIPEAMSAKADALADEGKTPLFFAYDGNVIGLIAVADTIKEDSAQAIKELREMGLTVVMLTGDNRRTADAIGKNAGVDAVFANVLPGGKEEIIRKLRQKGRVTMVGDGINDAPALTSADTGIAIGAGTDVAIDAADAVLMNSKLTDVAAAIRLSKATLRNIRENLFWAFIYNVIGIPLAAGVWIPVFGWTLSPMFGAAAMSLSSFCVVSNALRLNLFKPYKHKSNNKAEPVDLTDLQIIKETENKSMEKTVKINGMMCPRCEAHVKKALEAIPGVEAAAPSHTENNAVLTLSSDVPDDALKAAVEEAGYDYIG